MDTTKTTDAGTDVVNTLLGDLRQQIAGGRIVEGGDFSCVDGYGRKFTLDREELTVSEETCTGEWVSSTVGLPGAGEEPALPLAHAVLRAMGLDEDYDLVKR